MGHAFEMWLADLLSGSKEDRFFLLLRKHTLVLCEVAQAFNNYVTHGSPEIPDKINALESQGDEILTQLTSSLRAAFITPFDRQDIYNLAETIDDMIDYLDNAAREISLFRVSATTPMQAMASELEGAAEVIAHAIDALKTNPELALAKAREAQHAENVVEDRYRHALAELFEGSDVREMLKLREVYRHLSNSADRADAIGRLIGKIVVKST